ncbi:MAG: Rieske 2Fe-2S domain-containing protein [Rhodospirillales bacterium]|nr:Rieske 2Fe-2S domain-containing protein [Rhodospirillales bacterium]
MLSRENNERITRVGAGTPMGETLRRYWMPALLSWELPENDCPPVRVRLLGEDLVAFRATDGRIGMVEEYCPHRLASLWFGRNEENGLRCVYHGWKFDVDGNCTEQMNEPREFCSKVSITAYPTVEQGGIIWTYMGPAEKQPPLPNYAWTQVAEDQRFASKVVEECNWLQALEGGLDTSHFTILHRAITKNPVHAGIEIDNPGVVGSAPSLKSILPIMVMPISACARWATIKFMPAAIISSCPLPNCARPGRIKSRPAAIIGCRSTMKTAWSGISTIPMTASRCPKTPIWAPATSRGLMSILKTAFALSATNPTTG